MKPVYAALFLFHLLFILSAKAQTKYEIGIEGGHTFIKYKIKDAGDNLRNEKSISVIPGINFRINTNKKFFYEGAVAFMDYVSGLKLKQETGRSIDYSDQALMVPVRIGYYLKINDEISIAPVLGITTALKTYNDDGNGTSYEPWSPNPATYHIYQRRDLGKDIFLLAQGGLGFEYLCDKHWKASVSFNYYQGLVNEAIYDVEYGINNGAKQYATVYRKGSFTNIQGSIRYLFGKKLK